MSSSTSTLSLHWDGDSPLFVTDTTSTLKEIRVEGLLYYAPGTANPLEFVDRDESGFAVAAHWSGGHTAWSPANANHEVCNGRIDPSGYVVFQPGPDGIGDGLNVFQGVRNYNPQLAQWTTPDAYAGEIRDPISKKAYVWNRNNPFMYQDPSGYSTVLIFDSRAETLRVVGVTGTRDAGIDKTFRRRIMLQIHRATR